MKDQLCAPFKRFGRFLESIVNKNEIYSIDKVVMKMFGIWPEADKNRWVKVFFVTLVLLLVNVIPTFYTLIVAIQTKNAKCIGLVVPEIITNITVMLGVFNFCFKRELLKNLINEIDQDWKKKDFIVSRTQSSKIANITSLASHVGLHVAGIMYCSIPNFVFMTKRFGFNNFEEEFFGYQLAK